MIRITLAVLVSVLALALTGCSTLSVRSDWDEQVDFTTFQSFHVVPIQSPAHELVEKRIMDAIVVHLTERGFTENAVSPDMIIAVHLNVDDKVSVQTYNYGYPYGGYGYGAYPYWHGGTDVSVSQYQEGTLVIDLVDANKNEVAWRGWGTKVLDDSSGNAYEVQKTIDKILNQYPPK